MAGIKFVSSRNIPLKEVVDAEDRVVIVTVDGLKQTPKSQVASTIVGGASLEWDPKAAETTAAVTPLAFTAVNTLLEANRARYIAPTIDVPAATITKPAAPGGTKEVSYFQLTGGLPRSGKFWTVIIVDTTAALSRYVFSIGTNVNEELAVANDTLYRLTVTTNQIDVYTATTGQTESSQNLDAIKKILVVIDIGTGEIQTHDSSGFQIGFSSFVPNQLATMLVGGSIWHSDETAGIMTIETVDDTQSPVTLPVGAVPLTMINSALTSGAGAGDYLSSVSDSVYNTQLVYRGVTYYVGFRGLIPTIPPEQLAFVDRQNAFTKAQELKYSTIDVGVSDPTGVAVRDKFYWGETNTALFNALRTDAVTRSVTAGSVFKNFSAGNSLFGFGLGFNELTVGGSNVLVGAGAINLADGWNNVLMGVDVAEHVLTADSTSLYGFNAGRFGSYGMQGCTGYGASALAFHTDSAVDITTIIGEGVVTVFENTAYGNNAMARGAIGSYNTSIGSSSMESADASVGNGGDYNVVGGYQALYLRTGAVNTSVVLGSFALSNSPGGLKNVVVGHQGFLSGNGDGVVAIGYQAFNASTGLLTNCTGVGTEVFGGAVNVTNSSAFGYQATVTGDNQVQLGNSLTTTYVYGAVQARSDPRDKADIRPTTLGLEFILALEPIDYRLDMRDDYIDLTSMPTRPQPLRPKPSPPAMPPQDPNYQTALLLHQNDLAQWNRELLANATAVERWLKELTEWRARNDFSKIVPDGSHKRSRFHHGFDADKMRQLIERSGVDFGGYQDHSLSGGMDVKSLGYEEYIAPIVRSIQQLNEKVEGDAIIDRIAERMMGAEIAANNPLIDRIAMRVVELLDQRRKK